MSSTYIPVALRRLVTERDRHLCCYCRTAQRIVGGEFTVDHILPEALGGVTEAHNLCTACWRCNLIKGDRIVGRDPLSNQSERLYHPVREQWTDHFAWRDDGLLVTGQTATGRATVSALRLNRAALVESRALWIEAGWHPPAEV